MAIRKFFAAAAVFALALAAETAQAASPSFDCAKASTAVEKRLCQDDGLARQDRMLSAVYKRALELADRGAAADLRRSQRDWARRRGDVCSDAASAIECLGEVYKERIDFLRPLSFANLNLNPGVDVQADRRAPLVCLAFDAPLLPKQAAAPESYVESAGGERLAVRIRGDALCIEGLAHGARRTLTVRAGLRGEGAVLRQDRSVEADIPDRPRRVAFPSRGVILPRVGVAGLPIETVNVDRARVLLLRVDDAHVVDGLRRGVIDEQISYLDVGRVASRIGRNIWAGEIEIAGEPNRAERTAIPIGELAPDLKPGVYLAVAEDPEAENRDDWWATAQWFVVSDIGLTAFVGQDGLAVAARSLATARPAVGARIVLKAASGDTLAEATTGDDGVARIGAGYLRGDGMRQPQAIYAYGDDGDFVYLDVTRPPLDLSDRGIDGRPAPADLDAYLTTERGVYRPGGRVRLTALLRDASAQAVVGLPLTLKVRRHDGLEVLTRVLADKGAGGYTTEIALPPSAATGMWRATLHAGPEGPAIGRTQFLVEDFAPPRLEVAMTATAAATRLSVDVAASYLYGAPAADMPGEILVDVRPAETPVADRPGYRFGLAQEEAPQSYRAARQEFVTDADGKSSQRLRLDDWPSTSYPLEAVTRANVFDVGGRPVARRATALLANLPVLVGIRPLFADDAIARGGTAAFEVAAFDSGGARLARRLDYAIVREEVEYIWFENNGRWDYAVQYLERETIDAGVVSADGSAPAEIARKFDSWGTYRLEVTDPASGVGSSVRFHAGWRGAATAAVEPQPDKVKVTLPPGPHRPGDRVTALVEPPFDAEVMASVVDGRLRSFATASIPATGGEISLILPEDAAGGAYILVNAFAKAEGERSLAPRRAIGAAWAAYDPGPKSLDVTLTAPAETLPDRTVDIRVQAGGGAGRAFVTLAAVDDGVLGLTGYRAPDPAAYFLGKRRLGMDIRDVYGRFIDAAGAAVGRVRSGGDAAMAMKAELADLPAKSLEVVALFSGVVETDAQGRAVVPIALPEFSGRLRLMAQAWSEDRVGAAETTMLARRPVVAALGLPRFLSPGDRATATISLKNLRGPEGLYRARLAVEGMAQAAKTTALAADLAPGGGAAMQFDLSGVAPGDGWLRLDVSGPDGLSFQIARRLSVRPAAQVETRRRLGEVAPGGSFEAPADLLDGLYAHSARVAVGLNPLPDFDLPGILMGLARYPYGCAEQTTSTATPLLYARDLAQAIGVQAAATPKDAIEQGIARLLGMQTYTGGFGFWDSREEASSWTTAYVTDFLIQAAAAGYETPAQPLDRALRRLARPVDIAVRDGRAYATAAYALYVRTRAGVADPARVRRFADAISDRAAPALAHAFVGAALAAVGDRAAAAQAFAQAKSGQKSDGEIDYRTYGSAIRDLAASIALAAESGVVAWPELEAAAQRLSRAIAERRWLSTQEQAWVVRAAAALGQAAASDGFAVEVDGARVDGAGLGVYRAAAGRSALPRLRNLGDRPVTGVLTAVGAPIAPLPAVDRGFVVARSLFDGKGAPVDPAQIEQNDLIVVVLSGRQTAGGRAHALLVDYLPAGFELENARLGGEDLGAYRWLGALSQPEHVELRDDRFVAAFASAGGDDFRIAYLARAVTPGRFVHGGARVEAMYRPTEFGRGAPAAVVVAPR